MRHILPFFLLLSLPSILQSQTERHPLSKPAQIKNCRKELKIAFLNNDPAAVSLWMDSLARLEDDIYTGLVWDERWLLYYWLETYGNLTDEAARFDAQTRQLQMYKIQPPRDPLFEVIDSALYEDRYTLFTGVSRSFLNEEERAFITLQLEYLLRLDADKDAWRDRLDAFLKRYPESRFNNYLRTLRPPKIILTNRHRGGHILFMNNQWQGPIARSMRTGFGIDMAYTFGRKRLNYLLHFGLLWQKTAAPIFEEEDGDFYEWPKNDPVMQVLAGGEIGYDIAHTPSFRIWPAAGGGFSWLGPTPAGSEGEQLPPYYDLFNYFTWSPTLTLNADVKLKKGQPSDKGGYTGIRCRLGYEWMFFNGKNSALSGNMFFFAVGWTLYHRKTISR